MAEKRLDVIIGARNQLGAGFAAAQRELGRFQSTVAADNEKSIASALTIGKALLLARLAVDGALLATRLLRGEFEQAATVLEKLPMGIGPIARGTRELYELWSGVADRTAEVQTNVKRMEWLSGRRQEAAGRKGQIEGLLGELQRETAATGMTSVQAAVQKLDEVFEARRQRLQELIRGRGGLPALTAEEADRAAGKLHEWYDAHLEQIEKGERERTQKEKEAAEERADREKKRLTQEIADRREAVVRAQEQLKETRLRLLGDELGAEKARMEAHYRERFAAAKSAAEIVAIQGERALAEVDLERRRRLAELTKGGQGPRTQGATMLGERFAGLAQQQRAAYEETRKRKEEEIAAYAKQQVTLLDRIDKKLGTGAGGLYVLRLT